MRTTTSIPRIYADPNGLKHHELTEKLIGIFYSIYNELGHAFLESVYEQAFSVALAESKISFQRQIAVPVWFRGQKVGEFRADLVVDEKVIVELKTGREIEPAWEKQLLNYLRATRSKSECCSTSAPAHNSNATCSRMKERIRENPRESVEKKYLGRTFD